MVIRYCVVVMCQIPSGFIKPIKPLYANGLIEMPGIPSGDEVKNTAKSNGKDALAGGIGVALGTAVAGQRIGPAVGGTVAGASVGGQNGNTIALFGMMESIREIVGPTSGSRRGR